MKYYNILAVLLLSSILSFYSCNDSSKTSKQETQKPAEVVNTPATPNSPSTNTTTQQAPQNTGQVFHYTCLKGCTGGADSAVNCATCGSLLVHNAAFHNKSNSTPPAGPFLTPQNNSSQNVAGVFHYTCSNGCAGGSGSAGNCSTCGNALTHNAAYHN